MRFDLICVGDLMLDVLVPPVGAGERVHAAIVRRAGGSAVNAALAAAASGAAVAVVGRVGDDAAGAWLTHELQAAGVEPLLSIDAVAATGMVVVGEGTVADRGANATLDASHVPAALDASAVFVSRYLPDVAVQAVVERARDAVAGGHADTPVPIMNEREALELTGAADARGAVRALADGRDSACVTLAERGCLAARGAELVEVSPPRILDTSLLGAGDRFAAGFLLALGRGETLHAAATAGCAFATRTRDA